MNAMQFHDFVSITIIKYKDYEIEEAEESSAETTN